VTRVGNPPELKLLAGVPLLMLPANEVALRFSGFGK
jgi:hypothetical protein